MRLRLMAAWLSGTLLMLVAVSSATARTQAGGWTGTFVMDRTTTNLCANCRDEVQTTWTLDEPILHPTGVQALPQSEDGPGWGCKPGGGIGSCTLGTWTATGTYYDPDDPCWQTAGQSQTGVGTVTGVGAYRLEVVDGALHMVLAHTTNNGFIIHWDCDQYSSASQMEVANAPDSFDVAVSGQPSMVQGSGVHVVMVGLGAEPEPSVQATINNISWTGDGATTTSGPTGKGTTVKVSLINTNSANLLSPIPYARVVSDPAGIDCPGECQASFDSGKPVKLIEVGIALFRGWSGDCAPAGTKTICKLTASGTLPVDADFEARPTLSAPTDPLIYAYGTVGVGGKLIGPMLTVKQVHQQCGGNATCIMVYSQRYTTALAGESTQPSDGSSVWESACSNAELVVDLYATAGESATTADQPGYCEAFFTITRLIGWAIFEHVLHSAADHHGCLEFPITGDQIGRPNAIYTTGGNDSSGGLYRSACVVH